MLWTIAVILLVLWALGMFTAYTAGGLVHLLLVIALIVIVFQMRSIQVAEASCRYCADVLIPDVPACEQCARIEPRIMGKLRARTLDSPVQFCTAVVSPGTGLVCSACDEVIVGRQRNYLGVGPLPTQLLRMHPRCARVWQVLGRPAPLQS